MLLQSHISFASQTPFLLTCAAVALSWKRFRSDHWHHWGLGKAETGKSMQK